MFITNRGRERVRAFGASQKDPEFITDRFVGNAFFCCPAYRVLLKLRAIALVPLRFRHLNTTGSLDWARSMCRKSEFLEKNKNVPRLQYVTVVRFRGRFWDEKLDPH